MPEFAADDPHSPYFCEGRLSHDDMLRAADSMMLGGFKTMHWSKEHVLSSWLYCLHCTMKVKNDHIHTH